jgi:hypothetical protein
MWDYNFQNLAETQRGSLQILSDNQELSPSAHWALEILWGI